MCAASPNRTISSPRNSESSRRHEDIAHRLPLSRAKRTRVELGTLIGRCSGTENARVLGSGSGTWQVGRMDSGGIAGGQRPLPDLRWATSRGRGWISARTGPMGRGQRCTTECLLFRPNGLLTWLALFPPGPPPSSLPADPFIPSAFIADSPPVVSRSGCSCPSLTSARLSTATEMPRRRNIDLPRPSTSPPHLLLPPQRRVNPAGPARRDHSCLTRSLRSCPRVPRRAAIAQAVRNKVEAAYRRTNLFECCRRFPDDWKAQLAGKESRRGGRTDPSIRRGRLYPAGLPDSQVPE